MRNHTDKTRDIARSILPSTARRAARAEKRAGHHRARQVNRRRMQRLAQATHPDDVSDDLIDYRGDLDNRGWDSMVENRRDADKTSSLRRWTKHHLANDPTFAALDPLGREARLLKTLGDTVAGRHAVSHVKDLIGEQNPYEYGISRYRRRPPVDHGAIFTAILAAGAEGPLNKAIKEHTPRGHRRHRWEDGVLVSEIVGRVTPWLYEGDRDSFLRCPEDRDRVAGWRHALSAIESLASEYR